MISQAAITAANGLTSQALTGYLVPRQAGSWHLYASADDCQGGHGQTGLIRTVVVQ